MTSLRPRVWRLLGESHREEPGTNSQPIWNLSKINRFTDGGNVWLQSSPLPGEAFCSFRILGCSEEWELEMEEQGKLRWLLGPSPPFKTCSRSKGCGGQVVGQERRGWDEKQYKPLVKLIFGNAGAKHLGDCLSYLGGHWLRLVAACVLAPSGASLLLSLREALL